MISGIRPLILTGMTIGGVVAGTAYRIYRKDLRTAIVLGAYAGAVPFALAGIQRLVQMVLSTFRGRTSKPSQQIEVKPSVAAPSEDKKKEHAAQADKATQGAQPPLGQPPPIPPKKGPSKQIVDQYEKLKGSFLNKSASAEERAKALGELSELLRKSYLPPLDDKEIAQQLIQNVRAYDEYVKMHSRENTSAYSQSIENQTSLLFDVGENYFKKAEGAAEKTSQPKAAIFINAAYWLYLPAFMPPACWKKDIRRTNFLYFTSIVEGTKQLTDSQRELFRTWVKQADPYDAKLDEYLYLLTGCLFMDLGQKEEARGFLKHDYCSKNPIAQVLIKKLA